MRVDKYIAILVGSILTLSTIVLIHGMYAASGITHARKDQVSYFGGWLHKMKASAAQQHRRSSNDHDDDDDDHDSKRDSALNRRLSKPPGICPPKSPGAFWGGGHNSDGSSINKVGWCQQRADQCSDEYFDSLPTYDDYIAAGMSRTQRAELVNDEQRQLHDESANDRDDGDDASPTFCDPFTVPFLFVGAGGSSKDLPHQQKRESRCLSAMQDPIFWDSVDMIQPKFEQRTVKYVVTLKDKREKKKKKNNNNDKQRHRREPHSPIRLLMKVPQASFATEPFSEITAFALDRALRINRIPPTVLVPFPLARLSAAAHAVMPTFRMIEALGYSEKNFSKWWESEFYHFVQKSQSPKVMANGTHLWVSLQLRLEGVTELLASPLRVPYSRKHPGWHRWFSPKWEGFAAVTNTSSVTASGQSVDPLQAGYEQYSTKPYSELLHASMMALSEMAIFDFLMLNNDRSPNKNNFIVEGCYTKRKWKRSGDTKGNNNNGDQAAALLEHQKDREIYCSNAQLSYRTSSGGKKGAGADDLEKKEAAEAAAAAVASAAASSDTNKDNSNNDNSDSNISSSSSRQKKFIGRVERRFPMTFVHLDQGMAFHGFSFVNNPIEKKINNTFCMFYKPLMERVRCFLASEQATDAARAERALREKIPEVAQRTLGRKKVKWIVGQLSRLIEKRDACIAIYGEDVVMQPSHFPRD